MNETDLISCKEMTGERVANDEGQKSFGVVGSGSPAGG